MSFPSFPPYTFTMAAAVLTTGLLGFLMGML